jgi:hypothetical protein
MLAGASKPPAQLPESPQCRGLQRVPYPNTALTLRGGRFMQLSPRPGKLIVLV